MRLNTRLTKQKSNIKYFKHFKAEIGQLFAKIKTKENEAIQKIEQYEKKAKLKAFEAEIKNLLQKFEFIDSEIEVDFLEIV